MKLIIAGGRDYNLYPEDIRKLSQIHAHYGPVTEVVSGCASGADAGGEWWAKETGIPVKRFSADWSKHGRAAGPIRNRHMAEYADAVALFPGGAGTASMKAEAIRSGIKVFDFTAPIP